MSDHDNQPDRAEHQGGIHDPHVAAETIVSTRGDVFTVIAHRLTDDGCIIRFGHAHAIVDRTIVNPWKMDRVEFEWLNDAYRRMTGNALNEPQPLTSDDLIRNAIIAQQSHVPTNNN